MDCMLEEMFEIGNHIKGIVHSHTHTHTHTHTHKKSSFTHSQVVPNPYDFFFFC